MQARYPLSKSLPAVIYADFNDFDAHGNLPLVCSGSRESCARLRPSDGDSVILGDGEIYTRATIHTRPDWFEASSDWRYVRLERLARERMHSGHLSLDLTESVDWADFPAYAHDLQALLQPRGRKVRVVADAVDLRIREIEVSTARTRVVWSDFPFMVSLESRDDAEDAVLDDLFARLSACRS